MTSQVLLRALATSKVIFIASSAVDRGRELCFMQTGTGFSMNI